LKIWGSEKKAIKKGLAGIASPYREDIFLQIISYSRVAIVNATNIYLL
jgi:hypothetical protein